MTVRAEVSYLSPTDERAYYYIHGVPDGQAPSNVQGDRRSVEVQDARLHAPSPTLDREGVELVEWSEVPADENDSADFARNFYPRVEALVSEATGATRVHAFDHNLRSSDKAMTRGTSLQSPVWLVHNDYTEASGPQRVRDLLPEEAEKLLTRRFAVINVWKPIHGPVYEAPLAVCDAQTIRPEDMIPTDLRYPDRTGEIYSFAYSGAHRWFYYPEMTPDETLLIKCYDSGTGPSRFTAHTAIQTPDSSPGAPPRRSIEIRTLAFFE